MSDWEGKVNEPLSEKQYIEYFMYSLKRISKRFGVVLDSEAEIRILMSFADEHLTDSHQMCDLIETIVKIIKYREEEK